MGGMVTCQQGQKASSLPLLLVVALCAPLTVMATGVVPLLQPATIASQNWNDTEQSAFWQLQVQETNPFILLHLEHTWAPYV